MRSLLRNKYFPLLAIIPIALVVYLFGYDLIRSIIVSVFTTVLLTIFNRVIQIFSDNKSMPKIKSHLDHDASVEEISQFLHWLVKSKNVCDLATLYVRDELDSNEINLIANQGLEDPSPMYGPLVFDDFRNDIDKIGSESFDETIKHSKNENPEGFRVREKILSRASFILANKNGRSLAALYLNWRNKQEFTKEKKKELVSYSKQIFSAVQNIKGISIKRQLSNNAELRTRRWVDYNVTNFKNLDELIVESIYQFLQDFDRSKLRIEIWRSDGDQFVNKKKIPIKAAYDRPYTNRSDSDDDISDITWVRKTTRPKILPNDLNYKHKIIMPIRLHSDLSICSGVILIECFDNHFIPELVKPLCYLADHFSQIEAKKTIRRK